MKESTEFEQFARHAYPDLDRMFEIYKMDPKDLIGKTVYSNRGGFSCGSYGGTPMIAYEIISDKWIRFKSPDPKDTSTWSCDLDKLYYSIRFTQKPAFN